MTAALTYDRLTLGGRTLLEAGKLALAPGRFTLLMGRSGSGKTTLLRLLAGLPVDNLSGNVKRIQGPTQKPAPHSHPVALPIALMGQKDDLLPWASLTDNVRIGALLRTPAASCAPALSRARADALLTDVGLGDRRTERPGHLSGGERRRVALARTLFEMTPQTDPARDAQNETQSENRGEAIALLDEPFAALDALRRLDLQAWTRRLLAGRTALWVTHDPTEAFRMADDLLLLRDGKLEPIALDPAWGNPPRAPDQPGLASFTGSVLALLAEAGSPGDPEHVVLSHGAPV